MSDASGNATWEPDDIGVIKTSASAFTLPENYEFCNGRTYERTGEFAVLYEILSHSSFKVSLTKGSKILTLSTAFSNSGFGIGWPVELAGAIPAGTKIAKLVGTKEIELTAAASATVTSGENLAAIFFPWGNGNGTTTFNIPNIPAGTALVNGGTTAFPVAVAGGAATVTLAVTHLPSHAHGGKTGTGTTGTESATHIHNPPGGSEGSVFLTGGATNSNIGLGSSFATAAHTGANTTTHTHAVPALTVSAEGGGEAHSNMPPYVGTSFIIKVS